MKKVGDRFGSLVIRELVGRCAIVVCDCGTVKSVASCSLPTIKSCGCYRKNIFKAKVKKAQEAFDARPVKEKISLNLLPYCREESRETPWVIYGLADAGGVIRYVGKSSRPQIREMEYNNGGPASAAMKEWLKTTKPEFVIIKRGLNAREAHFDERGEILSRSGLLNKSIPKETFIGKHEIANSLQIIDVLPNKRVSVVCLKCGVVHEIESSRFGRNKDCGCSRRERPSVDNRHSGKPRSYGIWSGMKYRCKNLVPYVTLGYEADWNDYKMFIADVGEPPSHLHELDRIDNERGYFRGNCRWVDKRTNCNNRSTTVRYLAHGKNLTIAEWSRELNVPAETLRSRIELYNKTPDEAFVSGNKSNTYYTHKGLTLNMKGWAERWGVNYVSLTVRIKKGTFEKLALIYEKGV